MVYVTGLTERDASVDETPREVSRVVDLDLQGDGFRMRLVFRKLNARHLTRDK